MTTYRRATLDSLPARGGRFYVYATAERIDLNDSDDFGESGWVDLGWSRTTIHENRNDVAATAYATTLDVDPDDEDMATWRDVILDAWGEARRLMPTTITDSGDGTYYGDDAVVDHRTGETYRYALHAELVGTMSAHGADVWALSGLPTD